MKKFLVIQTAFIGDVVLATSLLEKIHHFYEDAQIDVLVRNGNEQLFKNHPFIHQTLVWNKKSKKYINLWKLLKTIRTTEYDVVINVQRYAATGILTAFSAAKMTIGFQKNPFSFLFTKSIQHQFTAKSEQAIHEIERNNALISFFTDEKVVNPKLYPSKEDFEVAEAYKKEAYICIAPASVWFTKQFPTNKWISFIQALPKQLKIYLLGAPTDAELCASIIAACSLNNIENLAGKLSFLQSAALQKTALMNYVNDSAPMHFASSVNAPVTVIYCSTAPHFGYGPLSDIRFIVETEEQLSCKPCGLHGHKACPEGHFNCAMQITNQQLLSTLPL